MLRIDVLAFLDVCEGEPLDRRRRMIAEKALKQA